MTSEQESIHALLVTRLGFESTGDGHYAPTEKTAEIVRELQESGDRIEVPDDLKNHDVVIGALKFLGFGEPE